MFRAFLRYFLRGLLILAPATLTIYIVVALVRGLDNSFDLGIPGLGLLIVGVLITLVGWLGSSFLLQPLLDLTERMFNRIPLVGILYSSLRDLFEAFVGDNQKFSRPVMVQVTEGSRSFKVGFVTQDDLSAVELPDLVAVYFPDSYNFSGELMLVPREYIRPLNIPSAQAMKFVVSGGVAQLNAPTNAPAVDPGVLPEPAPVPPLA